MLMIIMKTKTVISQSDSSNEEKDNSILPPPTPIYELYDGYDFMKIHHMVFSLH